MSDNGEDIAQKQFTDKGKGKERNVGDQASTPSGSSEHLEHAAYPPISDDAEETRRVQENLRRWEVAERQRRKAARESQSLTGTSLVTDVSRRASLLWPGRKGKQPSISHLGAHTVLSSQDNIDSVPLTDINLSPTPSPTRSDSEDTHTHDPFANPSEGVSPFDDTHASMTFAANSLPTSNMLGAPDLLPNPSSQPPPPMPINIPPPRSPPPITVAPPPPITPPKFDTRDHSIAKEPEVRWWHDWLCGCSEGPDRGGDFQAGRTNPFE